MKKDCLFCKIVSGDIPAHKILEDDNHMALLDIFPSVAGQTLILPKTHYGSYVFDMDESSYQNLMGFTRKVAKVLDKGLDLVRTCMVMEGMEIDHAHIKLYPIHRVITAIAEGTADLTNYEGYITTLHGPRANDSELSRIAEEIIRKNS
jgi:histidine triad (HIT) family protein